MSLLTYHNHRDGFATVCPHCDKQFDNDVWFKAQIDTFPTGKRGNNEFVSVLSNCPACGEASWAHWSKVIIEVYKRREEITQA